MSFEVSDEFLVIETSCSLYVGGFRIGLYRGVRRHLLLPEWLAGIAAHLKAPRLPLPPERKPQKVKPAKASRATRR